MSAAVFEQRVDPSRALSAALAVAVHLLLLMVLVLGVRWQSRPPETVSVELWEAPKPAPVLAPKAEPKPPEPKPEPKVEPKLEKPDIVEKAAPKPKPKPEPKAEPKPKPKPKPDNAEALRQMHEQVAQEEKALAVDREREAIKQQLQQEMASANAKALAAWIDKVRAKIRGNMIEVWGVVGNPEAVFDIVQLPTGEVLPERLRLLKSSGNPALDQAIERAILRSSPLPRPDRQEIAPRSFELKYRPHD
ncbi:MAG TPA: energy transducer TonB [Burkholderiales bacterium]|nr:energy transducer TonB [Burkholderiales bacterium]